MTDAQAKATRELLKRVKEARMAVEKAREAVDKVWDVNVEARREGIKNTV